MDFTKISSITRSILIGGISSDFEHDELPFSVLLPSFCEDEMSGLELLAKDLAGRGCSEMCFVGPVAEQAHDIADGVLEKSGFTNVVTKWHAEYGDACEYFLFAAMAGKGSLVAMIASHGDVLAELVEMAMVYGKP